MGKKFFKFMGDSSRPEGNGKTVIPLGEEAAATSVARMRHLIEREYSPEKVAVLKELQGEAAARYDNQGIVVDDVVAPDMLQVLSEQTGMRIVQLKNYPRIDMKLRALLTTEQAKNLRAIPLEEVDGRVIVAIADPSNPMIADDLRIILGRDVETVIANEVELSERIEQYYGMGNQTIEDLVENEADAQTDEDVIRSGNEIDLTDLDNVESAVIKLVNILLLKAIHERASDIHIEPFPNFIRVRYRVDGVLREIPAPPRNMLTPIVSRIKVMSGMNISENRMPQDGRVKLTVDNREVDMRVSTVPTVHGEAIVMRVLDKGMMMIGISQIGMLGEVLEKFKSLIRLPNGIILVTGPTGCGKTTTLYAALAEVRDPGEKLITTEDPVEYELEGIQQVNINENVGLTFARCLRSILRQDPDKVLVGEIRDAETAQIAVQASLTGHLVFSTLHTNSAAATVTRMLDMGVEPFLITSSLEAVVGQRLVRTICQICKKPYEPTEEELLEYGVTLPEVREEGIQFFHGEGCPECGHTGYHGRMGIFELLPITDEIRELILERATTDEIHEVALRDNMISMRRDGWIKACMGLTTLAEVSRQTPRESDISVLEEPEPLEGPEPPTLLDGGTKPEALPKPKAQLDDKRVANEDEAGARARKDGRQGKDGHQN